MHHKEEENYKNVLDSGHFPARFRAAAPDHAEICS